ncbi:MAG: N-acetyltransferase [Myxococcales bacterium]|nr:MAG: N-acetyltransferase [Myxococcales bacterium]
MSAAKPGETYIHPTASVAPSAEIGAGARLWDFVKVREGARVGAGASLGHGVYIDAEAAVGEGTKIQNGVSVYRGVTIGDNVFIGPNATFTNDRKPRAEFWDDERLGYTVVEDGASVGAGAIIVCGTKQKPRRIGRYAMLGAGAVVTADVPDFALVVGNPARIIGFVTEAGHRADAVARTTDREVVLTSRAHGGTATVSRELHERVAKGGGDGG